MSINQNSEMAQVNKINNVTKKMEEKKHSAVDHVAERHLESTFAEVHESKTAPVQAVLDKHLADAFGKKFIVIGAEKEEKPDYDDKTKINTAAVYHVRVISKKAWLPLGTELSIKIKDQEPIFSAQEVQDIMFGASLPVVVTFEQLSHYYYGLGDSLSAKAIHRTNLTPKEVLENE